jgi:L-ascorbate metabolism protein UlaG (beta-lactamase superfamily)
VTEPEDAAAPDAVTFLGHSALHVRLDSVRVLTDPLLRNRLLFLRRRLPPADLRFEHVDVVLISHLHRDHFDPPSLAGLSRQTRFVVPQGAGSTVKSAGFTEIEELRTGQRTSVGGVAIEAIEARHSGFRPPFGPRAQAAGFLIEGSSSVYFAGDTALYDEMAGLEGRVDLALLPVWGWGPNLRGGHMHPEQAAQALRLIHPRAAIPIHWGAYYPAGLWWYRPHLLHEPPREFAEHARRLAPAVRVHVIQPGQQKLLRDL